MCFESVTVVASGLVLGRETVSQYPDSVMVSYSVVVQHSVLCPRLGCILECYCSYS